jgi:hypothetical protein
MRSTNVAQVIYYTKLDRAHLLTSGFLRCYGATGSSR